MRVEDRQGGCYRWALASRPRRPRSSRLTVNMDQPILDPAKIPVDREKGGWAGGARGMSIACRWRRGNELVDATFRVDGKPARGDFYAGREEFGPHADRAAAGTSQGVSRGRI